MHTFHFTLLHFSAVICTLYSPTFLQFMPLLLTFYEHNVHEVSCPTECVVLFAIANQSGVSVNPSDARACVWQEQWGDWLHSDK